jgi:hypothetical protein
VGEEVRRALTGDVLKALVERLEAEEGRVREKAVQVRLLHLVG